MSTANLIEFTTVKHSAKNPHGKSRLISQCDLVVRVSSKSAQTGKRLDVAAVSLESAVFRKLVFRAAGLAAIVLGQVGCQHIGPKTIVSDRVPYNEAISTSWKEQTLLNIVKMRYADTPFFIDVAAITSGYSKSRIGNANASLGAAVS